MPSAPVSLTRRTMSCQASGLDSTMSETTTARSGKRRLTARTSARLASIGRSLMSSMFEMPTIRRPSRSSEPRREVTFVIGSPTVFQTAPPQPASKARATISPVLVGGALASQNGLGLRIPAMSTARLTPGAPSGADTALISTRAVTAGTPSAAAIERAASFPSWTAFTTSRPPLTRSPPAHTRGLSVRPVAGSTTTRPPRAPTEKSSTRRSRASWPVATMIESSSAVKRAPGTR